jgi:protein ImuB
MRYTAALSIIPQLQVDTVTESELGEVRRQIVNLLVQWSPQIEPCGFDQEVFWINASGLSAMHGAPEHWGAALRDHLTGLGYRVDLVIGFSRQGSYVLVRSWRRSSVVASVLSEQRAVAASPIDALPLLWSMRDLLDKLGVRTVAEFSQIPQGELTRRMGRGALAALNALSDTRPLQPVPLAASTVKERHWDDPLTDIHSLEEILRELLAEVLARLQPRAHLIESLTFELLGETDIITEVLNPARPTAHSSVWHRLIGLRLASVVLTSGVMGVRLDTVSVSPPPPAADLFDRPPRDLQRGEQAMALIRARWGNESVVRAELADSHVPELSYHWQPVERLISPKPGPVSETAIRRIFTQPQAETRGIVRSGPFVLQVISQTEETLLRRYWFIQTVDGQTAWTRQDGWSEPHSAGFTD